MNTAIQNFIEAGDITVQTGAASGGGSLSYNNGQFTFNPAVITDLTGYATETYVDDSIATLTGGVTIPSDINDLTDADGLLNTDINELSDVDGLLNTDINELSDVDGLLRTGQIVGGTFQTPASSGTTTVSLGSNIADTHVLITGFNFHNSQTLTANSSGEIDVVHGSSSDPETWYWQAVI